MKGTVFDIKRFAIHDGPGIRTSIFLKGCPLSCLWCQNPEGIPADPVLWYFHSKCIRCGRCIGACPEGALEAREESSLYIHIDRERCTGCGACVKACPTGALDFVGEERESGELIAEVMKDAAFYANSGGGMTLTGGDPLYQPEFALELLALAKEKGIHTAVETSMQADRGAITAIEPYVDLFIVDLKLIDSELHRTYAGVPNDEIKTNFEYLAGSPVELLVRIPLIPGFTDSDENLRGIGEYVASVDPAIPMELINYNPLAKDKYAVLAEEYRVKGPQTQLPAERLAELKAILQQAGVEVIVDDEE